MRASGIGVTVTGLSLTGAKAGEYVLTQPKGLTAAIEKATPTVTPNVGSYTYNSSPQGPDSVTVTGSSGAVSYSYAGSG